MQTRIGFNWKLWAKLAKYMPTLQTFAHFLTKDGEVHAGHKYCDRQELFFFMHILIWYTDFVQSFEYEKKKKNWNG